MLGISLIFIARAFPLRPENRIFLKIFWFGIDGCVLSKLINCFVNQKGLLSKEVKNPSLKNKIISRWGFAYYLF